jgi:hypothetical protein
MEDFVNFLRFAPPAQNDGHWLDSLGRPDEVYPTMPVALGDSLRILLPRTDLYGKLPESLRLRLLNLKTRQLVAQPVGLVRVQDAELYSEIKIRVEAPVSPGQYRQFALQVETPNPDYELRNLAAGRPVTASSTVGAGWTPGNVTDGTTATWSSDSNLGVQHEEWVVVELAENSLIQTVRMLPRPGMAGAGFPIDFLIEVSQDGLIYEPALVVTTYPQPADGNWREFALNGAAGRYVRIRGTRLGIISPGDPNYRMQLSEVELTGRPAAAQPVRQTPMLGTFREQQSDLASYTQAIREYYENYPYTPIAVDQRDNELTLRVFQSDRFSLGNALVRVGLGLVTQTNENSPSLTARLKETVTLPAVTWFRVTVSEDIEAGNTYKLNGITYVANGNETPADILAALGITKGVLDVASGSPLLTDVQLGNYTLSNRNQPTLELSYLTSDGGQDYYRAVVGLDVQPGNTYQITTDGLTTRSYIATDTDTAASVQAVFNTLSGNRFGVPLGRTPGATAVSGVRVLTNTNNPALLLRNREEIPARQVKKYAVYVGSSIRRGNRFVLGSQTVIAGVSDDILSIAGKFGYSSQPFIVTVEASQTLTAYAEAGPRYHEDEHTAAVQVISSPQLHRDLPVVAEVVIPKNLLLGDYRLVLETSDGLSEISRSNPIRVQRDGYETTLMRFGGRGHWYGMDYAEPGLVQQVRVPMALSAGKARQEETLGRTLDDRTVRGVTRWETTRRLTTSAQPEPFHLALLAALKHPRLWLDGREYRCEGEYSMDEPIGRKQIMNATATVVDVTSQRANRPMSNATGQSLTSDATLGFVLVHTIDLPDGLTVYLQDGTTVRPIRAGQLIPPGVYRLRISCGQEPLAIAAYVDSKLFLQSVLATGQLNRIDNVIMLPAGSELKLLAQSVDSALSVSKYRDEPLDPFGSFSFEFNPEQFKSL